MIDRDLTNREKLIMKCVWAENQEISIQDRSSPDHPV